MDLTKYEFPKPSMDVNTTTELVEEAEKRGFGDWNNEYHKLFSTLFYRGGRVKFKDGVDANFKNTAWAYCRALMGSFTPKHEHKFAVCAMILSELCEPKADSI